MVLSNDPAQQCRGVQSLRTMEAWNMAPKVLPLLENRDPTLLRVQVEILLWFSELSKNDFHWVFDSKTQQQVRLALSRIGDSDRNLEFPPQANGTTETRNRREILHDLSGMASRLLRKWLADSPEATEPTPLPLFSELELENDEPPFRRNPKRLYKGEVEIFLTYPDGSPHGVILQVSKELPTGILPAGTHLYFTPEGKLAALRPNQRISLLGMNFNYADSLFLDEQGNLAWAVLEEDGLVGRYRCARNFPISFDTEGRPVRFKLAEAQQTHEGTYKSGDVVLLENKKMERDEKYHALRKESGLSVALPIPSIASLAYLTYALPGAAVVLSGLMPLTLMLGLMAFWDRQDKLRALEESWTSQKKHLPQMPFAKRGVRLVIPEKRVAPQSPPNPSDWEAEREAEAETEASSAGNRENSKQR